MRLSLCLLTLNEIDGCKADVPRLPLGEFDEVYAVDGGSTDGTREYLQSQGVTVHGQDLRGYNGAYITAFRRCTTDAVVLYHPKGTIDPAVLLEFRPRLEGGDDVVIASRIMAAAVNEEDSKLLKPRKWFVMCLAVLVGLFWRRAGAFVWDVLHGTRGMRREAFFAIEPLEHGLSIDLEIVVRAYRAGLRCSEFPVAERPRVAGVTHFRAFPTGRRLLRYLLTELGRPAPQAQERESSSTLRTGA
jgi:glycosyltransferase involved in cell wall biosynthesis